MPVRYPRGIVCLLVVLVFLHFSEAVILVESSQSEQSTLKYEVESFLSGELKHAIQIYNPTVDRIVDGILFVPLFTNETNSHYFILSNITHSKAQMEIFEDDFGNSYAFFSDITVDPFASFLATIDYSFVSFGIRYVVEPQTIAEYDRNSRLYLTYTQPEELAQSDDGAITSRAELLTNNETNIHNKVVNIYDFVTSHLTYARQERERGALWALENNEGDCSEYSYLFVALCRAAGIPARIRSGFGFRSVSEEIVDGHMWSEYYVQDYGWIPVDPTWKLLDVIDEKHLSSMKGIAEVIPYANYFFNYTVGPADPIVRHSQSVQIFPTSDISFGKELVDDTLKAVKTISQARIGIFIQRIIGMPILFPSQANSASQKLLHSQLLLQSALEEWNNGGETTQPYISEALETGGEASHEAWLLVAYGFIIILGILVIILVGLSLHIWRKHKKLQRDTTSALSMGTGLTPTTPCPSS